MCLSPFSRGAVPAGTDSHLRLYDTSINPFAHGITKMQQTLCSSKLSLKGLKLAFLLLDRFSYQRQRAPYPQLLTHSWRENSWILTFPIGISTVNYKQPRPGWLTFLFPATLNAIYVGGVRSVCVCYIVLYTFMQHHNDTTTKRDAWRITQEGRRMIKTDARLL